MNITWTWISCERNTKGPTPGYQKERGEHLWAAYFQYMGNIALLEGPSRPTCFVTLNSFTIILDYALVMQVAVVYGVWFTLFCVFLFRRIGSLCQVLSTRHFFFQLEQFQNKKTACLMLPVSITWSCLSIKASLTVNKVE